MDDLERLQAAVGDRYELDRKLGEGGMARVFLAWDRKLHRPVAIKVLRPDVASAVGLDRFLREIEIAERLQHPFILPLFDSGGSGDFLYYVMPYVDGESLRARLDREGTIPLEEALRIAREVADALEFAHEHGVVHRDIKPENILLEGGHAVVADFGIARAISQAEDERLTASGHSVGTPLYMSPEQASGEKEIDHRADIYALSCVLYEMLVGRPPFSGPTPQAVMMGHMLEPPPLLNAIVPHIPSRVAATVQRGLAKLPSERFHSADELRASLESPIVLVPPAPPRSRWTWAVGLVVTGAVVAVVAWQVFGTRMPGLDPNRIVVFPAVDQVNGPSLAEHGRNVAIAIEIGLDQTEPLKWDDGWDYLDQEVRRDPLLFTAAVAREIALERLAGYYIDGALTNAGDSLAVLLNLHDVRVKDIEDRAVAVGLASSTTWESLGLQAMIDLLPSLVDPGRESFLPALAGRDPGAIALVIQGEREYRLSHFRQASDLYERALAEDSLLALAALKGALAASWEHDAELPRAKRMLDVALSRDSLLPPRYLHLARGIHSFITGCADSAVAQQKRAIAADSFWAEPWVELGEVYYHLMPSEAHLDSLAAAAFTRAAVVDTGFTPPLYHLTEIALRLGNTARADTLINRLIFAGLDSAEIRKFSIMLDCVRDGRDNLRWDEMARTDVAAVLMGAKTLSAAAAQHECAERGFRTVLEAREAQPGEKWFAILGLQGLLVAQGRNEEALDLLAHSDSLFSLTRLLYFFDVFAGAPFEGEAAGQAAWIRSRFGNDYERSSTLLHWVMGAWHARSGDVAKVERIAQVVRDSAEVTGIRRDSLLAAVLLGHLALARRDTAEAIARFDALKPTAPRDSLLYRFIEPLPVEKILLAKLLMSQGEYERAHDVAALFDHPQPVMFLPFLAQSLAIRLEAARAMGWADLAGRYAHRLRDLGREDLLETGL